MDVRQMMTRGFTPEARAAWSSVRHAREPRQFIDGHPWHMMSVRDHAALSQARSVCISFNNLTGRSGLSCTLRGGSTAGPIPVPGRVWDDRSAAGCSTDPYIGFDVLFQYGVPTELSTVIGILEPGDLVRLLWWPDGRTTGILREAGLHHDFVQLEVRRGRKLMLFPFADRISTGETGRLIRRFDPVAEPELAVPR